MNIEINFFYFYFILSLFYYKPKTDCLCLFRVSLNYYEFEIIYVFYNNELQVSSYCYSKAIFMNLFNRNRKTLEIINYQPKAKGEKE